MLFRSFVLVGLWRLMAGRMARLLGSVLLLTVLSGVVAVAISQRWGLDAAYWSTPARLGELLVGASLAVALEHWHVSSQRWGVVAVAGLTGIVMCSVMWPSSAGPAFHGWFTVFALLSAAVVLGVQVKGPMQKVLSWRPLVAIEIGRAHV